MLYVLPAAAVVQALRWSLIWPSAGLLLVPFLCKGTPLPAPLLRPPATCREVSRASRANNMTTLSNPTHSQSLRDPQNDLTSYLSSLFVLHLDHLIAQSPNHASMLICACHVIVIQSLGSAFIPGPCK